MTRADHRCLLQQLAFNKSRHFSWDNFPANNMAYDIESLTVHGHQLCHPLRVYTAYPHHPDVWFTIKDHSKIYRQLPTQEYEVYQCEMMGRQTRYGTRYLLTGARKRECSRLVRVSIRDWSGQALRFHSLAITALGHTKPTAPTSQSLWLSLCIDGESEEWIFLV